MKPLSPRAQKALLDYRSEHALPTSVRAHLLDELVIRQVHEGAPQRRAAPEHAPRPPRAARGVLRLVRWAGPIAGLGLVLWFRPFAPSAHRQRHVSSAPSPSLARPHEMEFAVPAATPAVPQNVSPGFSATAIRARSAEKLRGRRDATKQEMAASPATAPKSDAAISLGEQEPDPHHEPSRGAFRELTTPTPTTPPPSEVAPAGRGVAIAKAPEEPRARPSLDEEVMQMRTAYDHLRGGDPLRALTALSEHARRFPDGKLVTMRKVARIQALCDLGKRSEASAEASRFLDEHAGSPYAARVRQTCAQRSNQAE